MHYDAPFYLALTVGVHNFLQAVKEKETLRRSYFLFVGAVVTNDVTVVLTSQSE